MVRMARVEPHSRHYPDVRTSPFAACLDETLRAFQGVPTYAHREREDGHDRARRWHRAAPPGHRRRLVPLWVCDPHMQVGRSPVKGGSEATVRIAKADIVPTTANLLEATTASRSSTPRAGTRWSASIYATIARGGGNQAI